MKSKHTTVNGHKFLRSLHAIAQPLSDLYYCGTLPDDASKAVVAVVGTRRPTPYGTEVTFEIAYKLARAGAIIISGLAFGIDATAHRAALEAGGTTIAVLAGGLDDIYPRSHRKLAQQIVDSGGAIISEYPPGTPAHKHHFLARNRLISGLSQSVIITEAAERSGALSTINHALDQNKDIYAVPGPITSALSAGPNNLIQQGAAPITNLNTLLDQLHIAEAPSPWDELMQSYKLI